MPTKKIADVKPFCRHPDHNPPSSACLPSGIYEHECSGCHVKVTFTVQNPTL